MHQTFLQEKNGFEKNLILKKETKKYSYFSNVTCFFVPFYAKNTFNVPLESFWHVFFVFNFDF